MLVRFAIVFHLMLVMVLPVMAQNRSRAEATVNSKRVTIEYGRPAIQGRDMLALAKPGTVWRIGMNEATEIESAGTLVVGGKELSPGKYSLWARMTGPDAWVLAFHPQTGIWGQPELTSGYVAEMPLRAAKVQKPVEQVTISLADRAGQAAFTVQWGDTQLTGTFGVK